MEDHRNQSRLIRHFKNSKKVFVPDKDSFPSHIEIDFQNNFYLATSCAHKFKLC